MMRSIDIDVITLSTIVEGNVLQLNQPDVIIKQLLIDSRKLMAPIGAVFFAIDGVHHDGHAYINELYNRGVRIFIVEKPDINLADLSESTVIQVSSSILALQKCVAYKRSNFNIPVIGITGSNAKTIIKEWLSQVFQADYSIVKSPRSYNSQVGVPLSVWQMNERHELGIFEAGISQKNEMFFLQKVIQPTVGIFTNIGSAHAEGFENNQEKINEKLLLFSESEALIYCKDHTLIHNEISKRNVSPFTWSLYTEADIHYEILLKDSFQTSVSVIGKNISGEFIIPFTDEASIENALHVSTTLFYFGNSTQEVSRKITALHPIEMRLELKEAINGCYLIDDSYNNDFAGLMIALDFLKNSLQRAHKSIIISDVLESGLGNEDLYKQLASVLESIKPYNVFAIGKSIRELKNTYSGNCYFYDSTNDFLADVRNIKFDNEVILVKGARVFQFEKIVERLQ